MKDSTQESRERLQKEGRRKCKQNSSKIAKRQKKNRKNKSKDKKCNSWHLKLRKMCKTTKI